MEEWRIFLYPMGFLASLAFGARFIIQWLMSEKAQKSLAPPIFWQISLIGNLLLMLHGFIQIQYLICTVQACHAVLSWRNLNLMKKNPPPFSLRFVILLLLATLFLVTFAFMLQDFFLMPSSWFRVPVAPWQDPRVIPVSFFWNLTGTVAYLLFSSRFWVQWWMAEKDQLSELPSSFWWLSLMGALLSIFYFLHIEDSVNLIGPLVGLIPYVRNLMLIQKRA